MPNVLEINDIHGLASYRYAWNLLLPQTDSASFFQSLDWLEVYWRHYGQQQQLRVLIVFSAGQPIGILPLVVRTEPTRVGPVRVLTYPLHDWGTFYGPLGPHPAVTLRAGLEHVRRTPRDWDVLDLRWISDAPSERDRTRRAMKVGGFPAREVTWARVAQADLSSSWDEYWASRTSRWRNNVRRCEHKLAERGTVQYVRYRPDGAMRGDGDPRWDLYDACETIAEASWQADSESGTTLSHAQVRPFLRDAHEAAARAGAIDLNLLLLDGRPVAFNYAYHYAGYVFGLRTGYDASLSTEGAGTVLQHRMIRGCFERGDHTYDLGADYLDCKRYWQTCTRSSYRYTYFPSRVAKAQVLRIKRALQQWFAVRDAARAAGAKA